MTTRSRKLTVKVNNPIRLKCSTDEKVRLSAIKWFRNGHRISDEANLNEFLVEKNVFDDHIYTTLAIKHATPADAGIYVCKFGQMSEKILVDVLTGDEKIKSSGKIKLAFFFFFFYFFFYYFLINIIYSFLMFLEIRSNQDESEVFVPSISQSISDAMFSSASSPRSHLKVVVVFNKTYFLFFMVFFWSLLLL